MTYLVLSNGQCSSTVCGDILKMERVYLWLLFVMGGIWRGRLLMFPGIKIMGLCAVYPHSGELLFSESGHNESAVVHHILSSPCIFG